MKKTARGSAAKGSVAVIGLGIMGSSIAANLVNAGFRVRGYDVVAARRNALVRAGGTAASSVAEAVKGCTRVITSLPSPGALDAVAEQLAEHAGRSTVVAEVSTLTIADKERVRARLAGSGIELLDCPLSGTGAQARVGDLAVYASGSPAAIRRMKPVFAGFARVQYDLGTFSNGMKMKLVANLLVAIHNVSAAEAVLLGTRSGLDADTIVRVVADGAGGSRMLQVRGPMMARRNYLPATMKMEVWQKDMAIIAGLLKEVGAAAPLFTATVPIYDAAMALGMEEQDTGGVLAVLERWSSPAAKPARPARIGRIARPARPAKRKK